MAMEQQVIDDIAADARSLTARLASTGAFSQDAIREMVSHAMPAIVAYEAGVTRYAGDVVNERPP